jgi:hypothetical protein
VLPEVLRRSSPDEPGHWARGSRLPQAAPV